MASKSPDLTKESIRVGTLVGGNKGAAPGYIKQILPHGFESFSITFWQVVDTDLKKMAKDVRKALGQSGATISSLAVFGNPLETQEKDIETRKGWEQAIDAAEAYGCDIVAGFTGRLRGKSIPDNMERYKQVFGPLSERAAKKGVRIAFENCPMGGTWQTGDWNIAHNPSAWELMFAALPAPNIGLEWEPCHQMCQLIDPIAQLREWAPRVFHLHGKDATVMWDVVRRYGIQGPKPYCYHRTPGFGDSNWADIVSILRLNNFKGAIDIEGWHDPVYRGDLEMTGQVHGLHYLRQCCGEYYVANPKT
jgi:sugar phosphate isomerase/epimerase